MWYEIIPGALVVLAAIAIPHGFAAVCNKLVLGNMYRRCLETQFQRLNYLRDIRITGDPYIVRIFEDIGEETVDSSGQVVQDVERDQCPADLDSYDPNAKVPEEGVCRVK